MFSYEIDLRNEYRRVVEWNLKAGKVPHEVTQKDIYNQKGLVDEEVAEFKVEMEKLFAGAVEEETQLNALKELCDVFVTLCYLDFLQIMEKDEYISLTTASQVMYQVFDEDYITAFSDLEAEDVFKNVNTLTNLKLAIMGICEGPELPFSDILNAVLDNNDLKIYTSIAEADEQLTLLDNEEDYYVDTNSHAGTEYYCVKRKSDGKVMKPKDLPKVDIRKIIGLED